jgi:hypothetical protein
MSEGYCSEECLIADSGRTYASIVDDEDEVEREPA